MYICGLFVPSSRIQYFPLDVHLQQHQYTAVASATGRDAEEHFVWWTDMTPINIRPQQQSFEVSQ